MPDYTFEYTFNIVSSSRVTFVSAPDGTVTSKTDKGVQVTMAASNKVPKREIKIFYKTENMLQPQLKYKLDEQTNEVACMVSFVPTFEPH